MFFLWNCNQHFGNYKPRQFPVPWYEYIFQIKYTEAISSNSTRKPLWFEISKMPTAVLRKKEIYRVI